jgi:hypothetical protein
LVELQQLGYLSDRRELVHAAKLHRADAAT